MPIQELAPQQEVAIDIRKLRDTKTPDSTGRVIPKEVTSGQATWREHGPQPLIGRAEVFSARGAIASSFSCSTCCSSRLGRVSFTPNSIRGVEGETSFIRMMETQNTCKGQFGPFDVTSSAQWSSS
ncbi:MAG: hypothetical protein ACRD4L_07450, partial [Pyrinomonadaceae bacterium]